MWPFYFVSAALGYLLGSFPTGYLVGRAYGLDIREHGSGNIGATNVVRVLGKKPGYLVFACDAFKGLLAAFLGRLLLAAAPVFFAFCFGPTAVFNVSAGLSPMLSGESAPVTQAIQWSGILAGLACILGHNYPVWLRFRGGKGVATTVGVLMGLMPGALVVTTVVWAVSFFLLRYVSLASMLGALALPAAVWFFSAQRDLIGGPAANPLFWFSVVAALMIFWRHRANVRRLLQGTEPRFARKTPPSPPVP